MSHIDSIINDVRSLKIGDSYNIPNTDISINRYNIFYSITYSRGTCLNLTIDYVIDKLIHGLDYHSIHREQEIDKIVCNL